MVRKLKHHEQKLLRKVDFLDWKQDEGHRDAQVMRTYHLQDREDYTKYNKICGQIKHLSNELSKLESNDSIRLKYQELLLEKLYYMGLINSTSKMSEIENKLSVSSICRRRLPVVMTRLKMSETISGAVKLIEQGHVRVGPQVVTDAAFLVTRNMEDFVTWTDQSKIKRNILRYRNEVDDFDIL